MYNTDRIASVAIPVAKNFKFVPEDDDFLSLFPHRHSWIYAPHPKPGERPKWQTEERYALSDRLILQGSHLFGVRFGSHTEYLMLDIDRGSPYHPTRDSQAIQRIVDALEPLGLCRYVAVSSSYSGGIHLYFPIPIELPCWELSQAAEALLQSRGFSLAGGQLELFPNPRKSSTAQYNAHRLPLQLGSYLLSWELTPIYTSQFEFVRRWRSAKLQNCTGYSELNLVLQVYDRRSFAKVKGKARKFLADLNAEIERGWTGEGQTNRLLGRIAMREYIFRHAVSGCPPLLGAALVQQILEVAISLPGVWEHSAHTGELDALCEYWGRAVERSKYYPYGSRLEQSDPELKPSWNELQAQSARSRIQEGMKDLIALGTLPATARDRAIALNGYGISTATLYKNKQFWHPKNLEPAPCGMLHPVSEQKTPAQSLEPAPCGMLHPTPPISLYAIGGKTPQSFAPDKPQLQAVRGSGGLSTNAQTPILSSEFEQFRAKYLNKLRKKSPPPPDLSLDADFWQQQLELHEENEP